jgi:ribonuclease BN (tRNA processing enzyme)
MTKETVENIADYHTFPKEVGEVAKEALVEKLILTHFVPPVFDEKKLKADVEEVYKGDIVIGKDLLSIQI